MVNKNNCSNILILQAFQGNIEANSPEHFFLDPDFYDRQNITEKKKDKVRKKTYWIGGDCNSQAS